MMTVRHQEAFENVIEEVAYTWFNRLIAIRFMEVNDYLPSGVRVLSSENKAKKEPDLVTTPFDTDLEFTSYEQDRIIQLKDDNKLDELFRMLFIKQCNKLHDILPELFEKTDDYSELLLTISFTDPEGIIHHLINDIEDVDFRINDEMYTDDGKIKADGQVEIIGWLYQYYISKKHDEIVNIYKGTVKKADIPAATQLFTTDWVVRYMVDNSLGRYWIERNPQSKLAEKLEFFVIPKNGEIQYVDEKINPTDMTFFDPCMGSGHILVYAFDVLMEIYREVGYSDRDAALSIVENNLFGMDIDKRAYQLAYFAVMMKARSYNRRALTKGISNNLSVVEESNSIDKFVCGGLTTDSEQNKIGEYLVEAYRDAQEIGTLKTIEKKDYNGFVTYLNNIDSSAGQIDLFSTAWLNDTLPQMVQLAKQAEIMSNKYAVVCTNPPYMNRLEGQLKKFVVDNYKAYSGDLFSVFIYHNFEYCTEDGYSAFMTPFVWLFIKSYQDLRNYILENKSVVTLVQMEYSAFEEATVPICTFVLSNQRERTNGLYIKLSEFKGGMDVQRIKVLEAIENQKCKYFYETPLKNYYDIEGVPFAFWASERIRKAFKECDCIGKIAPPKQGLATADNDRFLRKWYEIDNASIGFGYSCCDEALESKKKWFPYNKGGAFRRWYGNREYVVNWENDGYEIKNFRDEKGKLRSRPQNLQYYYKPSITWSDITSASFSGRYSEKGFIFDIKGSSGFPDEKILPYIKFFANKDRTQKFYNLEIENFNRSTIEVALMSVLCKDKTASFEEVLRSILTDDGLQENKYLTEFEKYDLLSAFWQQADVAFGYNDPKPTLEKLVITMFVTYAAKSIHTDMPQAWKPFISYKFGNIIAFMDNLMNSYLYGTRFDEISEIIYNAINGKNYLEKMEVETLIDCNIFAGVDELLISWIIGRLENEDIGAKLNGKTIQELCVERRKQHFGKNFRSEYFILQNAFDMIAEGKYQPISGIKNLVKEYTETTYKIDRYYRYFYFYFDKLEDATQFEKIRELVENIYTNEYLNRITVNWNNELADADGETGLTLQRDFFARHINYSKDRVVVIISDALRFEVAHTLFEKMQADEKCNASIGAMQGVLPSYTPLGMASLLPHKTIEYSPSYDVMVDGKACSSMEQREAILKEYKISSKCVQFDSMKTMKQADLRSIFTGQDVVYIYHNQIDARGDKAASENEVFTACEEAIEEIYILIKRIASQANTYHFIVTADHGFIYKRDKIQATDKIAGAASKSNSVGQRYSISVEEIKADGVCHTMVGKILGNDDERIVSFPLASDIFKVAGAGQNYVHGGCSPQEMLVPMIDVKVDKGKKETSLAEIALVSLTSKITNLITTLDFVQTESVSDIVKETSYRVYFISDNNEKISNENIVIADKKDKDTTKRMFRLRFNFKNKKYDKSQKYYLVAYDDKNDIEVLRHEIIMDIAFADDFGF